MLLRRYRYDGPVLIFDRLVADKWKGETIAVSEKKARQNLTYQVKKEAKLKASARVNLPGNLKEIEVIAADDVSNMG